MSKEVSLLAGNGLVLKEFSVVSIHGLGGVKLRCDKCHAWNLEWPAHVFPPRLLDLLAQVQGHWNKEHAEDEEEVRE